MRSLLTRQGHIYLQHVIYAFTSTMQFDTDASLTVTLYDSTVKSSANIVGTWTQSTDLSQAPFWWTIG